MLEAQRKHWKKLHTTKMDADAFADWINNIPFDNSCLCKTGFMKILQAHPPRFNDWERWTFEIHNIVNQKLGKPEITLTEAIELWNWTTIKDINDGNTEDSS